MEELVETCEPKYEHFLTTGRFNITKKLTCNDITDLYSYFYGNADAIIKSYKIILDSIELEFQTKITTGSESSTDEAISTYYSILFGHIINQSAILSVNKSPRIFPNYISIIEQDSSERALVYLYSSLIAILNDLKSCESFLESVNDDLLSVDAIVHILNALSPNKNDLRNWPSFVAKCEKKLVELEGPENAKDLLGVIL